MIEKGMSRFFDTGAGLSAAAKGKGKAVFEEPASSPVSAASIVSHDSDPLMKYRTSIVTRPPAAPSSTASATNTVINAPDGRKVIQHLILKTDTLQGLCLQFGIKIDDLRRYNKLWANDSIHLRKHLLIPLDLCTQNETYTKLTETNLQQHDTSTPEEEGGSSSRSRTESTSSMSSLTRPAAVVSLPSLKSQTAVGPSEYQAYLQKVDAELDVIRASLPDFGTPTLQQRQPQRPNETIINMPETAKQPKIQKSSNVESNGSKTDLTKFVSNLMPTPWRPDQKRAMQEAEENLYQL